MEPSSPFANRFTDKEFSPSNAERNQIRHIISVAVNEASSLDKNITHLRAIVDDLCQRRQTLEEHIEDHRRLFGIRLLPPELLQEIFVHSLPPQSDIKINPAAAPMLLTQVSSTWQKIALATPELWSSLHIRVPRYIKGSNSSRLYSNLVSEWLDRSGNSLLWISLSLAHQEYSPPSLTFLASAHLMELVVGFSRRWKHLTIRLPSFKYIAPLVGVNEADVPALKTILVDLNGSESLSSLSPLFGTPSLRHVSLNFLEAHRMRSLRWPNLTRIRLLNTISAWEVLDVLRHCLNLTECELEIVFPIDEEPQESESIALDFLETLRLVLHQEDRSLIIADPQYFSAFFDTLEIPRLRHLTFETDEMDESITEVPFISLLSRDNILESLDFSTSDIPAHKLAEIVRLCPSLKRLRLIDTALGAPELPKKKFFEILIASSNTVACPLLEEIDMELAASITERALLRFLLSRTSAAPAQVTKLRRAEFEILRDKPDVEWDLTPMIESGLKFLLGYCSDRNPISTGYTRCYRSDDYVYSNQIRGFWPEDDLYVV